MKGHLIRLKTLSEHHFTSRFDIDPWLLMINKRDEIESERKF